MKIKLQVVDRFPSGFTTLGYWFWTAPHNTGQLVIQVMQMSDWRFMFAVWGHEIIEALWCWLFIITTEECDAFDQMYEDGYKTGKYQLSQEPGHDPKCPYHTGHMMGVAWEHICIRLLFASWSAYLAECDRLMGIPDKNAIKMP